jgi:hypothetical protein
MARHIVLLGDSIFDNRAYTGGDPDVVSHLRAILPTGWRASLCAVDGSTTAGLRSQLRCVAPDASHLVVSVGGNDALGHSDLLSLPVESTTEALALFAGRVEEFESDYRAALGEVLELGRPTTVCTVYNGNFSDPGHGRRAALALTLFNDVILRAAFDQGLSVIELRLICNEPGDYANPIEPSGPGGLKIARAIALAAGALDEAAEGSRVWAGRPGGSR